MRRVVLNSLFLAYVAASLAAGCSRELGPTVVREEPTPALPTRPAGGPINTAAAATSGDHDWSTKRALPPTVSLTCEPKTATVVANDGTASRVFPIYGGEVSGEEALAGPGPPEAYGQHVVAAVKRDLATRTGDPFRAICVARSECLEVQVVSPCGEAGANREERAAGSGLTLGLEILLVARGAHYRYVVVGGLGHYCGPQ